MDAKSILNLISNIDGIENGKIVLNELENVKDKHELNETLWGLIISSRLGDSKIKIIKKLIELGADVNYNGSHAIGCRKNILEKFICYSIMNDEDKQVAQILIAAGAKFENPNSNCAINCCHFMNNYVLEMIKKNKKLLPPKNESNNIEGTPIEVIEKNIGGFQWKTSYYDNKILFEASNGIDEYQLLLKKGKECEFVKDFSPCANFNIISLQSIIDIIKNDKTRFAFYGGENIRIDINMVCDIPEFCVNFAINLQKIEIGECARNKRLIEKLQNRCEGLSKYCDTLENRTNDAEGKCADLQNKYDDMQNKHDDLQKIVEEQSKNLNLLTEIIYQKSQSNNGFKFVMNWHKYENELKKYVQK